MAFFGGFSRSKGGRHERVVWVFRFIVFAYLLWIPLPFASVIPSAWIPLTVTPLVLGAAWLAWARRARLPQELGRPALWWLIGGLSVVAIALLQITPLPAPLVTRLSPESWVIWSSSAGIVNRIDAMLVPGWFPLSVDPEATTRETVGWAARLALFFLATQLFRRSVARVALASVLIGSALIQVSYGLRHWSGGMMEIWGWTNTLIHGRMGGTFVNPNHLGHYLALILPMGLYLFARGWYLTRREQSIQSRIETLFTRHPVHVIVGTFGVGCALFGILLAKSRGTVLGLAVALVAGLALYWEESAARHGKRTGNRRRRLVVIGVIVLSVVAAAILFLGPERVTGRMLPTAEQAVTLVGRVDGSTIALDLFSRFPLTGSGLGTFENLSLTVDAGGGYYYRHAHNDWLELLATAGLPGFLAAVVPLLLGIAALTRLAWPALLGERVDRRWSGDWRRFAGSGAISLLFVALHALIDFNFYIPANSYTLAVIAGAIVAVPRSRRAAPARASGVEMTEMSS